MMMIQNQQNFQPLNIQQNSRVLQTSSQQHHLQAPNRLGGSPDMNQLTSGRGQNDNNRLHDFNQFHHQNKKIGAEIQIKGFNLRTVSTPYLVIFQGITSLSLKDTKFGKSVRGEAGEEIQPENNNLNVKYFVEYHATLHSNQDMQGDGLDGYYGRTCHSAPKPLVLSKTENNMLETDSEDFTFFHTSFAQETSSLVIEIVVIKQDGHRVERASGGFAICPIFEMKTTAVAVTVQSGSPRMFGNIQTNAAAINRIGKTMLRFEFMKYTAFEAMRTLVPQNCLVNIKDVVPGLDTSSGCFPRPRESFNAQISNNQVQQMHPKVIYLHNLQVACSTEFEKQFEKFLQDVVQEENGDLESSLVNVMIRQRSLHIGVNNSWQNLNEQERLIELEEPDASGMCRAMGNVKLSNFIDHPLVALTFRVEFSAELPIRPHARQISHTVAFQVFMPKMNGGQIIDHQDVMLECKIGNQVSMTQDLVWGAYEQSSDHYKRQFSNIKIIANISTDPTGRVSQHQRTSSGASEAFDVSFGKNRGEENKVNFNNQQRPRTSPKHSRDPSRNGGYDQLRSPTNNSRRNSRTAGSSRPPSGRQRGPSFGSDSVRAGTQVFGQQQLHGNDPYNLAANSSNNPFQYDPYNTQLYSSQQFGGQNQPSFDQSQGGSLLQQNPSNMMQFDNNGYQQQDYAQIQYENERLQQQMQVDLQKQMNDKLQEYSNQLKTITLSMQKEEDQHLEQLEMDQRTGTVDYAGQTTKQIGMIGCVFQNLLDNMAKEKRDEQLIDLSQQMRSIMQGNQFDDQMGLKVPRQPRGVMNFSEVIDLHPSDMRRKSEIDHGKSQRKQDYSLEIEEQDPLRACTISFQFSLLMFSQDISRDCLPKRIYFQMRFFTFPEVHSDPVSLVEPDYNEHSENNKDQQQFTNIEAGGTYKFVQERKVKYISIDEVNKVEKLERKKRLEESKMAPSNSVIKTTAVKKNTVTATKIDEYDTIEQMDTKNLSVSFDIDPVVSKIKDENIKLAKYMKEGHLTIDICDADSKFIFATAKVPMFDVLRQQEQYVVRAKDVEATVSVDQTSTFAYPKVRAYLQLVIENIGKEDQQMAKQTQLQMSKDGVTRNRQGDPLKNRDRQDDRHYNSKGDQRQLDEKDRWSRPFCLRKIKEQKVPAEQIRQMAHCANFVDMNNSFKGALKVKQQIYDGQNNHIISSIRQQPSQVGAENLNPQQRKKMRVDRYRLQGAQGIDSNQQAADLKDPQQPNWIKFKSLKDIESIRASLKQNIINEALGSATETQGSGQTLNVMPGHLAFVDPLTVMNENEWIQAYNVKILDPDSEKLGGFGSSELSLVQDSMELNHWVRHGKVERPSSFDMFGQNGYFELKPGQKIDLLFKFLTTREVDFTANGNVEPSDLFIRPRKIRIQIFIRGQKSAISHELHIIPSMAPVDHTLRYYEPEQSGYQVVLRPFVEVNYSLQFDLSNPQCKLGIIKMKDQQFNHEKEYSLYTISGQAGEAMSVQPMNLFVYSDSYKSELVAVVRIEIHSRPVVYSRSRRGIPIQQALTIPMKCIDSRQQTDNRGCFIQISSNKPDNIYQDEMFKDQAIRLIPQQNKKVTVTLNFENEEPIANMNMSSQLNQSHEQKKIKQTPNIVNAVDIDSGDLVYSWLLLVESVSH